MKRPILYLLVGVLSFGAVGGGTFGLLHSNNPPSQPTTEPDDGNDDVLTEVPQTAKDRFMTNLLAGDLEVNTLDLGINTGTENIAVNFTGALSYDGKKLATGDFSAISASGDLNLKVAGFDETISFTFPGDNTLYFSYMEKDFSVSIDTFTSILDIIPLFTSSEIAGEEMGDTTAGEIENAAGLDLNSLLDDLTDMLNNIEEVETPTGYDYTLEIPDLATIILSSDKNDKLTGIRLLNPIEIEGMTISLSASVQSVASSVVTGPDGSYQSLDTIANVVNTLSDIMESKTLTANINVVAKSIEDDSLDLDLNARLSADINNVAQNFDKGIYELSILPEGIIQGNPQLNTIDVHYENEAIYVKANDLFQGKITNQSIEDILAIVDTYFGNTESTEETENVLDQLFGGSILMELVDGNFDNIKSAIKDFNSYPEKLEITFDEKFLNSSKAWTISLNYEEDQLDSIVIKDFTLDNYAIDLTLKIEKSFSSAAIFKDLTQFRDYKAGVSIFNTVAELIDSKQFYTDYKVSIINNSDRYTINGEIGADLNNVDFNNIESLFNGTFKISAEANYLDKNKPVAVHLQDETLYLEYNNIIRNSIADSSLTDLIDVITNKFGTVETGENESIDLNEIFELLSLNVEKYNELIEKIKVLDFTTLGDFVKIDNNNNDENKITVKILPHNGTRSYIYLELNTADNALTSIKINNLQVGDAIISFELNLKEYADFTIKDTSTYAPLDTLLSNLTTLVDSTQFNFELAGSIVDDDVNVEPISIAANAQADIETTEFYGNIDLSAKLPTDNDVYNHHITFDNYFVGNGDENELLFKYYGNDNSANPMRVFISDGEFGRMFDVIQNIPEDNSLMFLFKTTTGITMDMPLLDIVNGNLNVLFNDYIKVFNVGASVASIEIDGALLGIESQLKLEIKYDEDSINELKIIDLRFGSKTINVSLKLKRFDSTLEAKRLHVTEPKTNHTYIDANYLDLFLQIGINTTQSRMFHLYGTFNITFSTTGLIGGLIGLILGGSQIYSSIDMKLIINDEDGSVNAVISILNEKSGNVAYSPTENGYRNTEFFIQSNNDCIIKQTRVDGGYSQYDIFRVTQDEIVKNLHYYLLKYTFNLNDMIFDIVDDAVLNENTDENNEQANVLNFKYENIIKDMKYDQDNRSFSTTIDLNNIIDLSRVTSLISQHTVSIAFTHTSGYVLESLTISGSPISISLLGSSVSVGIFLQVFNDVSNGFTMNYFNEFVRTYYENDILVNLGYYEYRVGNTGAIYTSAKVAV